MSGAGHSIWYDILWAVASYEKELEEEEEAVSEGMAMIFGGGKEE